MAGCRIWGLRDGHHFWFYYVKDERVEVILDLIEGARS